MGEFWAGLAGVLVGGALSLGGVWWTLEKQDQRDRKNDERALRDRRYDRLREALLEVVAAASAYSRRTLILNIALLIGKNEGKWKTFNDLVAEPRPDTGSARASLLLETEDDRAVLDKLSDLVAEDFLGSVMIMQQLEVADSARTVEEFERHFKSLQEKADALTELARQRLADLDQPVE